MVKAKYQFINRSRNKRTMLRIYFRGQRFEISTEIEIVDGEEFNGDHGYIRKTKQLREINDELYDFRSKVKKKIEDFLNINPKATITELRNYVQGKDDPFGVSKITVTDVLNYYKDRLDAGTIRNKITGLPLSQWTIHTRSSEISVLLELIGELPELDFKKYNVNTIPVFGEVLIKRKYGDFVESFLQKLIEKKYDDSTIYKYISTLRQSTFFVLHENALYTGDLLSKLKYKRPNYEVETITTEQAKFILDNYPRIRMECRTLQQQYALQYWITALLLSPRISDMKSWTRNNIFKVDGETWIKYYAQKTQNSNPFPIEVPVPEMLMPIFNRNILEFRGKLLPPMNSAINEKLETIAKRYQIFHNDVIRRRKKGGKPITKVMKGWQQVHIHMMRATAITLFVEDGMPESVVKGFSGHTTDSQSFRRYVKISNGAKKKYYNQFQNNLLASI